ncbi:HEAT repeat domain-containing protein [Streptomyces sp. NPDC008238]
MINDLDSVDWSSMGTAYGSAGDVPVWLREMTSPDPEVREKAFGAFYSAAHHQGDVYPCTVASLPFLFDMADDPATPDRASVVELLLSIGREALDRGEGIRIAPDGTASTACEDAAAMMRERAGAFVTYASDPDPRVRQAAIEGLGLFLDDAHRAVAILRDRLRAESGMAERVLVVRTMAHLARRLPATLDSVTAWLDTLADDTSGAPDIRLAGLVYRARLAPAGITDSTISTVIDLLRRLTPAPRTGTDDARCRTGSGACACTADTVAAQDVPPQIAAAFADLERHNRTHAPTTSLLSSFHRILDERLPERMALLGEQLRNPDPATRYDAIRMAEELVGSFRGDHAGLVMLIAECLLPEDPYTAAAAAESLAGMLPVSEPAREALAAYVIAQRTVHGPDVWATPNPLLRRAHQEAVMALARMGDVRALPDLLTALDTDSDAWRVIQVAGDLRSGAAELVPRLTRRLTDTDFSGEWSGMSTGALMSAMAELGDSAAVPALTDAVTAAVRHEQWPVAVSAVEALASFGPEAASALDVVRPLTDAQDVALRTAATAAVWELEGDAAGVLPHLEALLDSHRCHEAADVLGRIGPPARPAVPRLREMLHSGYEWTRIHAAAALWDIAGEAEAGVVVPTLLAAWEKNGATSNHVLRCLNRMGPATAPALPRIRAELALSRRLTGVAKDEELQRLCRAVVMRLA